MNLYAGAVRFYAMRLTWLSFTLTTRALVLLSKMCFLFQISKIVMSINFHELMNQYQACLYSVECISHHLMVIPNNKTMIFQNVDIFLQNVLNL